MTKAEAVLERAREDMRNHLGDFCKYGPIYLKEYVDALLRDATTTWKARQAREHIHPKLAEFVRELALDAAVLDRRTCGAAGTPVRSDVVSRDQSPRRKAAA